MLENIMYVKVLAFPQELNLLCTKQTVVGKKALHRSSMFSTGTLKNRNS